MINSVSCRLVRPRPDKTLPGAATFEKEKFDLKIDIY